MNLGIALDGLLCNKVELEAKWTHRLGADRFLEDAVFWTALKPYDDVAEAIGLLAPHIKLYVFAERSKSLFLPTRAWLRNNIGLVLPKDRLIMQAIKRYDCRLNDIHHFVDSNYDAIQNLKVETVAPITSYYVDRERGEGLIPVIQTINSLEK